MSTKITINDTNSNPVTIGVGDWLLLEDNTLCVIAQTQQGQIQLIGVKEVDANRVNGRVVDWVRGEYRNLSSITLAELIGNIKYQKVDVEIIVNQSKNN